MDWKQNIGGGMDTKLYNIRAYENEDTDPLPNMGLDIVICDKCGKPMQLFCLDAKHYAEEWIKKTRLRFRYHCECGRSRGFRCMFDEIYRGETVKTPVERTHNPSELNGI